MRGLLAIAGLATFAGTAHTQRMPPPIRAPSLPAPVTPRILAVLVRMRNALKPFKVSLATLIQQVNRWRGKK